jgi:hypothetical protein
MTGKLVVVDDDPAQCIDCFVANADDLYRISRRDLMDFSPPVELKGVETDHQYGWLYGTVHGKVLFSS